MLKKLAMTFILFLAFTVPVHAQQGHLVILVDLSSSAAHVQSAPVAAKIGAFVAQMISSLPLGSRVSLRTFGLADATQNWLALDYRLVRKKGSRPRDVAVKINLILANIPKLVAEKKLALQQTTHVLRTLQDLAGYTCGAGSTLLIISDLMEHSPDADCYRLVKSNQSSLPAPLGRLLSGVKVIAIGAGHGLARAVESRRLKTMWSEWFKRAGVTDFKYVPRL